jgi:D-glycero-beta-D-manno-heptose-7-phosphate kinase
MNQSLLIDKIDAFKSLKVLVIGDVILDAYYSGTVNRISPEAPVSVLDIAKKEYRLGGAANVAVNLQALGAKPILCSIIGSDFAGRQVLDLMTSAELSLDGIHSSASRITSVKTRLVSNNNQLIRMDEEQTDSLDEADDSKLNKSIDELIDSDRPDAIVFEDYDKGALGARLITKVIAKARTLGIPVSVDPKKNNFLTYAGATLYKPNMKELREGLNLPNLAANREDLLGAFSLLNEIMPVEMVLFTLSSDGVFVASHEESHFLKTETRQISDVSGAGDSVISVATCAKAVGATLEEIALLSNLAGGWVCQYPGVVPITSEALKSEVAKSNKS